MLKHPEINAQFVEAVDGKALCESGNIENFFDMTKNKKHYNCTMNPGEIGCTLSHQKCYRIMLQEALRYAVILEDDIIIENSFNKAIPLIKKIMSFDFPAILLLSGMYWYSPLSLNIINDELKVVKVRDALLTSSYCINSQALPFIIEEKPFIRADDWLYMMKKGIKIFALNPHVINQDWSGKFKSTLNEHKEYFRGHPLRTFKMHLCGLKRKIYEVAGCYENA